MYGAGMIVPRSHRSGEAVKSKRHVNPLTDLLRKDTLAPLPFPSVESKLGYRFVQGRKTGMTPQQFDRTLERKVVLLLPKKSPEIQILADALVPGSGDERGCDHKRDGKKEQSRCHGRAQ
jgi:hypothetical protein